MNQNPLITIADWHGRNGQDFEATVIREAVDRIETLEAQLDRAMKGYVFVEHIQWHLDPSQHVICKICGKSVDEIYEDEKDKHWIVEGE